MNQTWKSYVDIKAYGRLHFRKLEFTNPEKVMVETSSAEFII